MAVVNRYSRIQPARYNPRSLQELMVAPQYMRQQHDAIQSGLSQTETALAQVDPLSIHSEAARMEQDKLYNQITEQADLLAKEGFNPMSKSNFLKLNKEYQSSIGPQGTLGKINAARQAMATNREAYIKEAVKEGYSPEQAGRNWAQHASQYADAYGQTGEITSIGSLYAPKYINVVDEAREMFKEVGVSSEDISKIGSYIKQDENGQYVLTQEGRQKAETNAPGLRAAVQWLSNNIANPNSDLGRSLQHQGKSPLQAMQEISGLADVYLTDKTVRESGSKISNLQSDEGAMFSGMGIALANEQFTPSKYSGMSLSEINGAIANLSDLEQLEPGQAKELQMLNNFKAALDKKLMSNDTYVELNNESELLQNQIDNIQPGMVYDMEGNLVEAQGETAEIRAQKSRDQVRSLINRQNQLRGEMDALASTTIRDNTLQMSGYQITPITSKQQTLAKVASRSIENLLKVSPETLKTMVDIEDVRIDGSPYSNISEEDRDGIANILYNAKPGSLEIVQVIPRGFSGRPEYVVRVQTNDDVSYDMDGIGTGELGGGTPMEIKLSFSDTGNGLVGNVNKYLEQYVASTGEQGQQLANSMEINRLKSRYGNTTWGELIVDTENLSTGNTVLDQILLSELRKKGVTNDTPDDVIDVYIDEIKNEKLGYE